MQNEILPNQQNLLQDPSSSSGEPLGAVANAQSQSAVAEVQAQFVIAKKFPRNVMESYARILGHCERFGFAKEALYQYPRGGQTVTGPSIRLAELAAQNWGNLKFGIKEVEQGDDFSVVQSYCLDLETNVLQEKTFKVPHYRYTRAKGKTRLTDPRDIYELIANQGARRLRACILGVIPKDVIDDAAEKCRATQVKGIGNLSKPEVIKKLVTGFATFGVSTAMIEEKLGHALDSCDNEELAELMGIAKSLKDKMSKREDWFSFPKEASEKTKELNEQLKGKSEP